MELAKRMDEFEVKLNKNKNDIKNIYNKLNLLCNFKSQVQLFCVYRYF